MCVCVRAIIICVVFFGRAQVVASCHSLVNINESELIGDPLEQAMLGAVEWNLTKGSFVLGLQVVDHFVLPGKDFKPSAQVAMFYLV